MTEVECSIESPLFGVGFFAFRLYACSNESQMLLREANSEDVPLVCALEKRPEYYGLIGAWSADEHLRCLADPEWRYFVTDQAGELAGFAILCGITSPHKSIELKRIVIASAGQGLGKEMLRQIIRKVFSEYGAHRLWLDVFDHNVRAQRAYAAAGFRHEGMLREAVYRDGGYHSLMLMSILDREYREQINSARGLEEREGGALRIRQN